MIIEPQLLPKRQGNPHVHRVAEFNPAKSCRRYAYNREGNAFQRDGLACDGRIQRKFPSPVIVADNGHSGSSRLIVVRRERPSERDIDTYGGTESSGKTL